MSGVHFEPLEWRRLCSVSLSAGTLRISTGDAPDQILVRVRATTPTLLRISVNGARNIFHLADVNLIIINSLGGDDQIDLSELRIKTKVNAGGGNDVVIG